MKSALKLTLVTLLVSFCYIWYPWLRFDHRIDRWLTVISTTDFFSHSLPNWKTVRKNKRSPEDTRVQPNLPQNVPCTIRIHWPAPPVPAELRPAGSKYQPVNQPGLNQSFHSIHFQRYFNQQYLPEDLSGTHTYARIAENSTQLSPAFLAI